MFTLVSWAGDGAQAAGGCSQLDGSGCGFVNYCVFCLQSRNYICLCPNCLEFLANTDYVQTLRTRVIKFLHCVTCVSKNLISSCFKQLPLSVLTALASRIVELENKYFYANGSTLTSVKLRLCFCFVPPHLLDILTLKIIKLLSLG